MYLHSVQFFGVEKCRVRPVCRLALHRHDHEVPWRHHDLHHIGSPPPRRLTAAAARRGADDAEGTRFPQCRRPDSVLVMSRRQLSCRALSMCESQTAAKISKSREGNTCTLRIVFLAVTYIAVTNASKCLPTLALLELVSSGPTGC